MSAVEGAQAVPRHRARPRDHVFRRYDPWLAGAALVLILLGLVMVASASMSTADRTLGDPFHYFRRQAVFVGIGLLLAWGVLRLEVEAWHRSGALLLVGGVLLLALVLVPGVGREVNGSMRWLRLGPVNVQVSEPVKLFLVVYLAGYLVRRADEVRSVLRGFIKPVAVLALIAGLLLLEPDYGGCVVLFSTAFGLLFLGGVPLASFVGWLVLGCGILGALVVVSPYRLERLTTFLDPWSDPFGSGFQLTQALIAIGRGEWFGVGLGAGVQKLFYLPEAHTDFIFSVLAEELGFAGMALVVGLFAFIVWRAFAIARRAELRGQLFSAYLAYGIGLLIGLQSFINIGVNMGVLPTKGLTLPLMSYGGSSVIMTCVALGLLLRIDHEARRER